MQSREYKALGLRVVRSDDWDYEEDQDGGEGGVGTVVEVGGQGGSKNPDKTVVVVWDIGVRAKYRTGYNDKDDLRVLDSAPTGSVVCMHISNISAALRSHNARRRILTFLSIDLSTSHT